MRVGSSSVAGASRQRLALDLKNNIYINIYVYIIYICEKCSILSAHRRTVGVQPAFDSSVVAKKAARFF